MPDHIFQFVGFNLILQPGVVFGFELRAGEEIVLGGVRCPFQMRQQSGGIVRADAFPERRNRLRGLIGHAEHAAEDAFHVLLGERPADFLPDRGGGVRTIGFDEALKPEHPRVATPGEESRPCHEHGESLRAEFFAAKRIARPFDFPQQRGDRPEEPSGLRNGGPVHPDLPDSGFEDIRVLAA